MKFKIHNVEQGSADWLKLRAGKVTASEASNLVTPKRVEIAKGDAYLMRLIAERWLGRPITSDFKSKRMDDGTVLEGHSLDKFTLDTGLELEKVGFVTTDDDRFGFSPDSMVVGGIVGVEAKNPGPAVHAEYLIKGVLPDDYRGQVQSSMWATGADHWWFVSSCPSFTELIIRVERDEKYLKVFAEALKLFNERLDAGYAELLRLNQGIPPAREPEKDLIADFYGDAPELEGIFP